jgi:predicted ATPase/DNA-binding SARP family transcriptional activator
MNEYPDVRVLVLGPVRVADAQGEREVAARRQRSLIAALAVRAGRAVPVSDLVDAVWEDVPPEQARSTLQSYVSRLRSGFGPIIEHGPGGYRLAEHVRTDVDEVRAVAAHLDRTPPSDHDVRARLALGALERWTGSALGDLREDLWFAGVRAELDELEATLLDIAAEALIAAGRASSAVGTIEARALDRQEREPTQALLVRALHAAGRTAEALRAADRYRTWLRDETGLLPGHAFIEAERAALAGPPEPGASRASAAAPAPAPTGPVELARPTPLVGREHELEELSIAIGSNRIVTVTGVGGVGKTRLVAELTSTRDDVDWIVVGLASVEPGGVAAALATRLGYRDEVCDLSVLVELLRASRSVLVFDNGEHVVTELRHLVRELVDRCLGVCVLVTSRSRLDLPDEEVFALGPLDVSGPRAPAVLLFLDRLRRAGARRHTGLDHDDPSVIEVCRRLDGVPLALELAASRAAVIGLDALARRLDAAIDLLASSVDTEGRHATLRNVIEWSVDLLSDVERRALNALGSFRGPFNVDDAEAVVAAVVDESVAPIIGRLADTSLIAATGRRGEYRLLQMIRHFALHELERSDHLDAVMAAHAAWVASTLLVVTGDSVGPDEARTSERLDALRAEVTAALNWACASERFDAAGAIVAPLAGPLLYRPDHELVRAIYDTAIDHRRTRVDPCPALLAAGARCAFLLGELSDVDMLAHPALDHGGDDPAARHRAAHALGVVRLYQGRFEESRRWFERVRTDEAASLVDRLDALGGLGLALCYSDETSGAGAAVAQHRALCEVIDSDTYRAFGSYMAAECLMRDGDHLRATDELVYASELAWSAGARFVWGIASTVLAAIIVRSSQVEEAHLHLPTLIERWRRSATWPQLWMTLRLVAELIHRQGGRP